MSPTPSLIVDKPLIIGHRGLADDNIENSLPAIRDANSSCDMIEIDIRSTADGKHVVFHDKDLQRSSGVPVSIEDSTYEELLEYNLFGSDQNILSLEEAVQAISIPILAEIKQSTDIESIVNASSRTHYQSFDPDILREVRRHVSSCLGLICAEKSQDDKTRVRSTLGPIEGIDFVKDELTGTFVSIPYDLVTEQVVEYAHNKNVAVFVWDLKSNSQVEEMEGLGVDGLIIDSMDVL